MHRWQNTKWVLFVVILCLTAIAGGLAWHSHNLRRAQANARTAVLIQTQKLLDQKNYSVAELKLQDYIATNPPSNYKRDASIQLASTYANAGDLSKALQWYKGTAKLDSKPQLDAVTGLAYTYRSLKDTRNAITYFGQAVSLEQQSNIPDKNAAIATYQYLIKQMSNRL